MTVDAGTVNDAGDGRADALIPSDANLPRFLRGCSPLGIPCGGGLVCLAPGIDAGTQGICTFPCDGSEACRTFAAGLAERHRILCAVRNPPGPRVCVMSCGLDSPTLTECPEGRGTCQPTESGLGDGVCVP